MENTASNVVLVHQWFGLGDVIFEQTIVREIAAGRKILWPVATAFVDGLNRAYPDITFVDKSLIKIDYDRRAGYILGDMMVMPLQWADVICQVPFKQCMQSKYMLYGKKWQDWKRNAMWTPSPEKQKELYYKTLGLKDGEKYLLVNPYFRTNFSGNVRPAIDKVIKGHTKTKIVEMNAIPGFSLFDWQMVIENAMEIHTVSTSLLYILEMLPLKMPIHFYLRHPDEKNLENVEYIFTKPYIIHSELPV